MPRILKIANSAYYGQSGKISTIRQAVVLLGLNTLRTILLGLSFRSTLLQMRGSSLDYRLFWRHSLAVAAACRSLARMLRKGNVEEAFLAGLLHDLGKILLDQIQPFEASQSLRQAVAEQTFLCTAEQAVLGYDHAQIGGWAGELWNLPPALWDAIAVHHTPSPERKDGLLSALVYSANLLAHSAKIHAEKVSLPYADSPAIETMLPGLSHDLPALLQFLAADMAQAQNAYGSLENSVA